MLYVTETPHAPHAIGCYSQAIGTEQLLFVSGQIPLVPQTMQLIGDDISSQIHQVFQNLKAIVAAAHADISKTLKLTIYLTNLAHFDQVNDIMAQYFEPPYPARATIQVSALPKGAQIEVDAVVLKT